MAPGSDIHYFPALEDCLFGYSVLLSWQHVATALLDSTFQRQKSPAVVAFLKDSYVQGLLKDPGTLFDKPSAATQKSFETKTAPINVTTASNDRIDVKTVKEDAEWLSKNAGLNLVDSLRIVVVEFQARSSQHLKTSLSAQDAANLQDAAGLVNGQGGTFLADIGVTTAIDAEEIWHDFELPDSKRKRLFETYLSERRYFTAVADHMHSIILYRRLPIHLPVVDDAAELYEATECTKSDIGERLSAYTQSLGSRLDMLCSGLCGLTDTKLLMTEQTEIRFLETLLTEVVHLVSVVMQLADSLGLECPPPNIISSWFSIMKTYDFLSSLAPYGYFTELSDLAKVSAVAASVALLKPVRSMDYVQEELVAPSGESVNKSFVFVPEVLMEVHSTILGAFEADISSVSPLAYVWHSFLSIMKTSREMRIGQRYDKSHPARIEGKPMTRPGTTARRNSANSILSIESSRFDSFEGDVDVAVIDDLETKLVGESMIFDLITAMSNLASSTEPGPMTDLASSRIRAQLAEVLQVTEGLRPPYLPASVSTMLDLLCTDRGYWDIDSPDHLPLNADFTASMLRSEWFQEAYLKPALRRFPTEFVPFVHLCRILCSSLNGHDEDADIILDLLRETPTFTFAFDEELLRRGLLQPIGQAGNGFQLLQDLPFADQTLSWQRQRRGDFEFVVPAGTNCELVDDLDIGPTERSCVAYFGYSMLSFLGQRLEMDLLGQSNFLGPMSPTMTAATISLLATVFRISHARTLSASSPGALVAVESDMIQEASRYLTGGKDIVAVVLDIMDSLLQDDTALSDDAALGILNASIHLLHSLLPLQPSRVWSYVSKCDLLGSDSRNGKLAKIVGDLDLVAGKYELLDSCLRFFSDLLDTAARSAVQRSTGDHGSGRQRPYSNPWAGISDKVISSVSYSLAQISIDVFENTSTWRLETGSRRVALLGKVTPILQKLVNYRYGMGNPRKPSNLTSAFDEAGSYVVDSFLQPATGTLRFRPILISCVAASSSSHDTFHTTSNRLLRDQIHSILDLCTILLRAAKSLGRPSYVLQDYLFKCCTLISRCCATSTHFLAPSLRLLEALIVVAGSETGEPPSLLGYLGPPISKSFLQVLASIDKPFELTTSVKATWDFFVAILRNRQQWMSNCLLTGRTPREAMKTDPKHRGIAKDSIFALALNKLSSLRDLDPLQAVVILDFVASAQNYWPWTVFTLNKETNFDYLNGLQSYVSELQTSNIRSRNSVAMAAIEARIASFIAEIFAMQLYHSRHLTVSEASALAQQLVNKSMDYYLRDGVEVAGYNRSLHVNFAKNFSNKYSGCSLEDFRRTSFQPSELGPGFYYDIDRANSMLAFDPGWLGRKDNGFKTEMELANSNLSLVDAQIELFHAWESLLLELSICLPKNDVLAKQLQQVAVQCLKADRDAEGAPAVFIRVMDARVNLALVLIQRLEKMPLPVDDHRDLLAAVTLAINACDMTFAPETALYYRKLLQTLYVSMRAYQVRLQNASANKEKLTGQHAVEVTQMVLNVLDRVVAQGFRSLVSLLHDDTQSVTQGDFALITALLQACLAMPGMEQSQSQIMNIMASHNCFYAATSLFSWADKLTDQGDPVYGELSVLFLLELSALPGVAEQMACDGILNILLTANLTKFMAKARLSPYAETPMAQRCYGIWVKGLLPLMLNLLTALGATVAPEVAYLLNQFPELLELSVTRFEAPGASRTRTRSSAQHLTLMGTSEVHSLALITRILNALRVNLGREIPEVNWNASSVFESTEMWLASERMFKDGLLPLGPREIEWRSMKRASKGERGDNVLEQKVYSQLEAVRDVLSESLETE